MKRLMLIALASMLLLTGCLAATQPSEEPAPDYQQLATDALGGLPGVVDLALTQEPVDGVASPDPADPTQWTVDLSVTVSETATTVQVVAVAAATRDLSEKYGTAGNWRAGVAIEAIDHLPDDDMPAQSPGGFSVYPDSIDAEQFMDLRARAGVETVTATSAWPFVTVTAASDLAATQSHLAGLSLWQNGGTLWAESGRVRLTELPNSLTAAGYAAIVDASIAYPTGQFWLEAPTTGNGWPRLYIDTVTSAEAAAITTLLTDASVSPAAANDYDVEFVIRADGSVDTAGVLGRR